MRVIPGTKYIVICIWMNGYFNKDRIDYVRVQATMDLWYEYVIGMYFFKKSE